MLLFLEFHDLNIALLVYYYSESIVASLTGQYQVRDMSELATHVFLFTQMPLSHNVYFILHLLFIIY
jgi:hypothetical protein